MRVGRRSSARPVLGSPPPAIRSVVAARLRPDALPPAAHARRSRWPPYRHHRRGTDRPRCCDPTRRARPAGGHRVRAGPPSRRPRVVVRRRRGLHLGRRRPRAVLALRALRPGDGPRARRPVVRARSRSVGPDPGSLRAVSRCRTTSTSSPTPRSAPACSGSSVVRRGRSRRRRTSRSGCAVRFGDGLAETFLLPYNAKVWAHPPEQLDYAWVGERVAQVDLERVVMNLVDGRADAGWGPNRQFRFPMRGGTGAIWTQRRRAAARRHDPLRRGRRARGPRAPRAAARRRQPGSPGTCSSRRCRSTRWQARAARASRPAPGRSSYSTVHVLGIGLSGSAPPDFAKKCWIYFPGRPRAVLPAHGVLELLAVQRPPIRRSSGR